MTMLAWGDSPSGSSTGAVVFATNLEETSAPYTTFGYLAVLDGANGKTMASQKLAGNALLGAGNIVVDAGCVHVYATTWLPEQQSQGEKEVGEGEEMQAATPHLANKNDNHSLAATAPIPITFVTVFSVNIGKGTMEPTGYGPPVVGGNLLQTYALGPADGQISLQTANDGTIQVLAAAA